MDHKVHTVTTKTDIRVAIGGLLKQHVTGAPVVDEVGRVVGMLTERDCLRLITLGVDGEIPSGTVASAPLHASTSFARSRPTCTDQI